ncbi:uncharacterized protein LOC103130644 [Poecilia formosa]|uniref:uncharacterized protein LOC103130644 n=1 Tax=Poecilia formosa TaxID=48698 RepID=UPI000443FEBC|nr:PREDICTED: uncharacterized protein LOC103130644 [Poecilia formosa]XP_016521567.1 PREDICTED: uncharacterized protein LOC103130644 [Poecilia formosa]
MNLFCCGGQSQKIEPYEPGEASLTDQMEALKLKKVTTGETFGADDAVLRQVLKKVTSSKKQKQHLIVFCPITSRVGSDVEAAMATVKSLTNNEQQQQAQDYGGLILVLMHHTRDPDYSTGGTNWSETTSNVALYVHVLFHDTEPGLLKCSQNDKAVGQIVDFLNKKNPRQANDDKNKNGKHKPDQQNKQNKKNKSHQTEARQTESCEPEQKQKKRKRVRNFLRKM